MKVNISKEAVKYGTIGGLLSLVVMYGGWAAGLDTFVSVRFISSFIPYVLLVFIFAGISVRKQNDNLLTFAQALKFSFLAYVIAELIFAVGTYVLFNLIDAELAQKTLVIAMEKTQKFMEDIGAKAEDIEKSLERTRDSSKDMNFKNIFLGMGIYLIWDFVLSLLAAVIIRREPKFEDQL